MDFIVVGPLVNAVPELRSHEKGLDERVYIARCSDVDKSFIMLVHI